MAEKDLGNDDGPSLELPSFSWGRKGRKGHKKAAAPTVRETVPVPAPALEPVAAADPVAAPDADEPAREKHRRDFSLPVLSGMVAAVVTGAVIGLLAVASTSVTLQGCEAVRGTSSCGGAGLFLLLAILIGLVYVGGFLLRAWHVPDPGSTSFLAVGLVAVVALLFLIDVLFSWTMIIVIPVVGMGAFALSHWVTTAFIEPADD